MNRYGQNITWSTPGAPHAFSGTCTNWSYRDHFQRQLDENESGDQHVLIQHSRKAEIRFDARVTDASTDFLDLSTGGAITITGVTGGAILVTRAVERWSLKQPKTASIQATHYPDFTASADAGTLDAFQPANQGLSFLHPGGKIVYGTAGLTHGAGVVHKLELTQERHITEDDPSPNGTILGAASHGYLRTIHLDVLTLNTGTVPANGTVLTIGGAPDHAADFRIESVETKFAEKRGKMVSFTAVWIPPIAS